MRTAVSLSLAPLLFAASAGAAGERDVTSGFGVRRDPFHGQRAVHRGVDLRAPAGTPVLAAAGGTVRIAGWHGGYGLMVEIVHPDASATRYAHLSRVRVQPAQVVAQGEAIGDVGHTGRATGSHLHFEYRVGGVAIDPLPYLAPPPATTSAAQGAGSPKVAPPVAPHRSAFAAARDRASDADDAHLEDGRTAWRRLTR